MDTMNKTVKHTPGPWKIWNGEIIEDAPRAKTVCAEPDKKADARLIAAAPELLEALKEAHPFLIRLGDFIGNGEGKTGMERCNVVLKVVNAIAKAEAK